MRLYTLLCRSVGLSVGWSHTTFFMNFYFQTSLLLPKWSCDLKYGPCPPARDFGSRVSGLVSNIERKETEAKTELKPRDFHLKICLSISILRSSSQSNFSLEKTRHRVKDEVLRLC